MTTINKKQLDEFKAIKTLFDTTTRHNDNGNISLYKFYESQAEKNVTILSKQLKLNYDVVINLIFDFDHTVTNSNNTIQYIN